jgi:hypothetical protein
MASILLSFTEFRRPTPHDIRALCTQERATGVMTCRIVTDNRDAQPRQARGTDGSQTRRWREMDSNYRSCVRMATLLSPRTLPI